MNAAPGIVLASASPRRSRVLEILGLPHTVDPAGVAEDECPGETPEAHVERLARAKARTVAARHADALVLAGDTVVVRDGRLLGKPADRSEAVGMLLSLAGRSHRVATGLALACPGGALHSRVDKASVRFRDFGPAEARAYADTGEPMDKAGAYGIQGFGAALVAGIEGDYYTVMGLSVAGLMGLLKAAGWRYAFGRITGAGP